MIRPKVKFMIESVPKKIKLPRGMQTQIADELKVTQAMVSMVFAGKAKSARISAAIERELARLKGKAA